MLLIRGRFPCIPAVLIVLAVVLLCPLSIWLRLISCVPEFAVLFDIRAFLKSSTLYAFSEKYIYRQLFPDTKPISNKLDSTSEIDISERKFLQSIVRSHRSWAGSPAYFMVPDYLDKSDLRKEANMTVLLAIKHQALGRYETALKLLKRASELDPHNSAILNLLGEAFEKFWVAFDSNVAYSVLASKNVFPNTITEEQASTIISAEQMYTKALLVDPTNSKAEANKCRTSIVVEQIDNQRFQNIDLKVSRFFLVPASDSGLKRAKMEHYIQHIYHSNAIEGNTLSLAQTRAILETRIAVGGKSLHEQNEVLGLDAAFKYLNTTLLRGSSSPLFLSDILELHRRILTFVDFTEAGRLRQTQVFVAEHVPPPAHLLPELMEELVDWVNSDEAANLHPIELAALTHWKMVYIHPFYDGNGRTARLLMNFILMRAGLPPAIVRKEDRHIYYETLKTANAGDVRPFIRFIAECTERTIDDYLKAASVSSSSGLTKNVVAPPDRPFLSQLGTLVRYTPLEHFSWMPQDVVCVT